MDLYHCAFSGSTDGCKPEQESVSAYSDPNSVTGFQLEHVNRQHEYANVLAISDGPAPAIHSTDLSVSCSGDSAEKHDFCDSVLKYINQVLMEDDMEDKAFTIEDSTLHAAEKYFYDILNERYPSVPNLVMPREETTSAPCSNSYSGTSPDANNLVKFGASISPLMHNPSADHSLLTNSPSFSSVRFPCHSVIEPVKYVVNWGGIENPRTIIPSENGVTFNFENNRLASAIAKEKVWQTTAKLEKDEGDWQGSLLRGKSLHREESALDEGRSNKKSAVDVEESILHDMFDKVLSFSESALHTSDDDLPTEAGRKGQEYEQGKIYDEERNYHKKGIAKKEALDMRRLLIQCTQSVADNDLMTATKLLKHIRLLSSPLGDASQRLAHYFANALEARLTSSRTPEYKPFSAQSLAEANVWRGHKLFVSAFPFVGISYFVATQMIMELAEKATCLHIIHFGIIHGLQWPPLIRRLSKRPGGPPKLRITAIGHPQIGFQPDARVKETGRRLATYCEKLKVPFEYYSFGQWETISVEDLGIQNEEVLVVNSLYQFQHLLDDTVMERSPRDAVLNLIRRINPDIFIHGVLHGTYNSPFFVSRLRESLFYFSSWFDMLDAYVPRHNQDRIMLEREIYGKAILNIIACEGLDRVERPETYRQWEIRTLRAGFKQLPLNQEILEEVRAKIKSSYHEDFFIDKADKWMIYGWRGRAFFAISSWKPA